MKNQIYKVTLRPEIYGYKEKTSSYIWALIVIIAFCAIFIYGFVRNADARTSGASTSTAVAARQIPSGVGCKTVGADIICENGHIYSQVTWKYDQQTIKAKITKYGCTKKCIDASGSQPVAGSTIACPKRFDLGTTVSIRGTRYTCKDRTAEWVQRRNGDTFDIFTEESEKEQRAFGKQTEFVTIINP